MKHQIMQHASLLAIPIVAVFTATLQPDPAWDDRYDGTAQGNDVANAVVVDVFGNTIVTGRAEETGTGYDAVTRSISPSGSPNWTQPFDGTASGTDEGVALVVDKAGNTYVAVTSEGDGTGTDIVVLKYDINGDPSTDWSSTGEGAGVRRYDHDESEEIAYDIALDSEGNVYVTGTTDGNGTGLDTLTIKVTPNGTLNPSGWPQVYNNSGADNNDVAEAIAVDRDGHVVIAGYTFDEIEQWLLIRYESGGNTVSGWPVIWAPTTGKAGQARDVVVDANNDVFATGWGRNDGGHNQFATAMWDEDGDTPVWHNEFSPNVANAFDTLSEGRAIALERDHNGVAVFVYSTGVIPGYPPTQNPPTTELAPDDYCTVKYDPSDGSRSDTWAGVSPDSADGVRRYDGPALGVDQAWSIAVIGRGSVYVTGESQGGASEPPDMDYATIRYNEDGDEVWVARYHNTQDDAAHSVAMTIAGAARVTGESDGTDKDYYTIMYEEAVQELATDVTINWGQNVAGDLESFEDDDGDRYEMQEVPPLALGLPSVDFTIEFESSVANPSELTVVIEANSSAVPAPALEQRIEIFDHAGSGWILLDKRGSSASDQRLYLTPPGDPARYLDGNDAVQVRIKCFDPGTLFSFGWRSRIDVARLYVLE